MLAKFVRNAGYEDEATGTMVFQGKTFQFTEVVLHPKVVIQAGDNLEQALKLHHQSHELCFITQSVAFPVRNEPVMLVENLPRNAMGKVTKPKVVQLFN